MGKTKAYYDKNPKAKAKKAAYDTEYNKKTGRWQWVGPDLKAGKEVE